MMVRLACAKLVGILGFGCAFAAAEGGPTEPPAAPVASELVEEVEVRLVLLDVVVVDGDGRTVPDLTKDDFEIVVGVEPAAIDTLDVHCPVGATEEPREVRGSRRRTPAPEVARRIVLAFDYLHLAPTQRAEVLDHAMRLVREGQTARDEVMVAALTGMLRVEQPFTADAEATLATLERMQHDITLWNGSFTHLSEAGWVRSAEALVDVLGTFDGRKAVVLYSGMEDVPLDSQFDRLAAAAATARCSFYPVDANGLSVDTIGSPQPPPQTGSG
jgi:VWFA-related protein